jgi:hypothetical protein
LALTPLTATRKKSAKRQPHQVDVSHLPCCLILPILAFGGILRKPARKAFEPSAWQPAFDCRGSRVGCALENAGRHTPLSCALRLVAKTLLMTTLLHTLAALVLGNFRFTSFFKRAHSGFQIREPGFNHLIGWVATHFFAECRPSVRYEVQYR